MNASGVHCVTPWHVAIKDEQRRLLVLLAFIATSLETVGASWSCALIEQSMVAVDFFDLATLFAPNKSNPPRSLKLFIALDAESKQTPSILMP